MAFLARFPGGATLCIVCLKLAETHQRRGFRQCKGWHLRRALHVSKRASREEPPSSLLARIDRATQKVVGPTILKMAPPPRAVPPAPRTRGYLYWGGWMGIKNSKLRIQNSSFHVKPFEPLGVFGLVPLEHFSDQLFLIVGQNRFVDQIEVDQHVVVWQVRDRF